MDQLSARLLRPSLQDASLQALSSGDERSSGGGGSGGGGSISAAAAALERMGDDLFALVDSDSDCTQNCACFVAFFSRAAAGWKAAGRGERARWCLDRAMQYSQQLEAQVASEEVEQGRKEALVVALFNLYLEGAKSAADNRQQVGAGVLAGTMQLAGGLGLPQAYQQLVGGEGPVQIQPAGCVGAACWEAGGSWVLGGCWAGGCWRLATCGFWGPA